MSQNNIFFLKLFKQSKLFCTAVVCFIMLYSAVLYKNMDMLFFPHNSMFSGNDGKIAPSTYAIKINSQIVPISQKNYLKKDFSETALTNFAKWIENDRHNFISIYINNNVSDIKKRNNLLDVLIPDSTVINSWPTWYAKFCNMPIKKGDVVEIWKYNFSYTGDIIRVQDSILVQKQMAY
jgi:hypothetical protein